MKPLVLLIAVLLPIPSSRQSPEEYVPPPGVVPQAIPSDVLYGLLFKEIANFDHRADQLAAASKPEAFFRHYHAILFDLTPGMEAQLKEMALPSAAGVAQLDQQAYALIRATKDHYHNQRPGLREIVPPPPQALQELQNQRTALISSSVERLAEAFGPAQFAVFEAHVRQHVGANFKWVRPTAPK